MTETRSDKLTGGEQRLAQAKDGLVAVALISGVISGVAGVRLATQVPDGAVPIQTGTEPAPETPESAARLQRIIGAASTINVITGVALVAVNGVLAQINYSYPPGRRALAPASSAGSVSPAWLSAGLATVGAAVDQGRRQLA